MTYRFAAVDVGYCGNEALAAAVLFSSWGQAQADKILTAKITVVAPYQPGQLYLRELPCILAVLKKVPGRPRLILVDGYVWLDESARPGLGGHLYHALKRECSVVGIAKSPFFRGTNVAEVLRGDSHQPLFVTSVGLDLAEAAEGVRTMHGAHRIPSLLREADRLSRSHGD